MIADTLGVSIKFVARTMRDGLRGSCRADRLADLESEPRPPRQQATPPWRSQTGAASRLSQQRALAASPEALSIGSPVGGLQ